MSRNALIAIATVVIVVLGGLFFISAKKSQPSSSPQTQTPTYTRVESSTPSPAATASASARQTSKNVVTITSAGFSPKNITIKAGETVVWKNQDSLMHTVNSSPHPSHTDYPPLNSVGQISAGEEKSFTFEKTGTYKYHDHLNPSLVGSVTVQ